MKFILSLIVLVRDLFLRLRWAADTCYAYLYTLACRLAENLLAAKYKAIAEAQELAGIIRREADLYAQHLVRKAGDEHTAAADLLDKIKRG
jgi:hypothetical protein